jgi:CheY-like chemotaxis protein
MSLVGNLEDLPLADILQIVSLSRKSGVLNLTQGSANATLYFQNGLVTSASITDFPLDLVTFLCRKQLLSADDEVTVRERALGGEDIRGILVEFAVPDTVVAGFSRTGIEKVVYRLFTWKEGAFTFELTVEGAPQAVGNPFAPSLPEGVNPQFLAMEGARLKDENDYFSTQGNRAAATAQAAPSKPPEPLRAPPSQVPKAAQLTAEKIAPPATQPAPVRTPAPPPTPAPRAAPRPANAKPMIVVVDNDILALKNIEASLVADGYEVAAFGRVEAVVKGVRELLRKGRPLVVLADLVMPKRDASGMLGGLEVLEVLRGEDQHVPIIILADLNNPEAKQKAEEMLVDRYMDKPGRKGFTKEPQNTEPEFLGFMRQLKASIAELKEKAGAISASQAADPFVDLSHELKGELEAATVAVSAAGPASSGAPEKSRGLDRLKEMVRELSDPHFNADVSLLVLRFATELMGRAVIFAMTSKEAIGLGQAGMEMSNATDLVRAMRIPLAEPSIFADVVAAKGPVRRRLDSTPWNQELIKRFGGEEPVESFAAPIFTSHRIAAIIYGDNAGEDRPIGDVDALEIFLSHAGIAMERSLLERRLRDLTSG